VRRFAVRRWSDAVVAAARRVARGLGAGAVRQAWRAWQARRWHAAARGEGLAPVGGAGATEGFGGAHPMREGVWWAPNFVPCVWGGGRRLVVTVHDLSCFDHPEWHPAERVRFMEEQLPRALNEAQVVTVVSEATKRRLQAWFGVPDERVVVTYPGVDRVFAPVGGGQAQRWLSRAGVVPQRYFLGVGTIEPRKNWLTVLQAYAMLPRRVREGWPLLVVGMKGWMTDAIEELAAPLRAEGSVRFLGFVPDEGLAALYTHTAGFFYLSFYEGFGLPPVEAMACGAPVVVGNQSSLPEVVVDAGVLLPPEEADAVRETMVRLAEDEALRRALAQRGIARAQRFTWGACAEAAVRAVRLAAG